MTNSDTRIEFIADNLDISSETLVAETAAAERTKTESVSHLGPLGENCEAAAKHIEETMAEIQNLQSTYIEASKIVASNVRQIARIHFEQSSRQEARIKKAIEDISKLRDEFNVS